MSEALHTCSVTINGVTKSYALALSDRERKAINEHNIPDHVVAAKIAQAAARSITNSFQ